MYSGNKYLVLHPIDVLPLRYLRTSRDPVRYNREQSSGLPHSEIRGSKLILSSSRLIAEYHVLHRLLLPRHSPNALLALDLIQKEQNRAVLKRYRLAT